MNLKTISIFLTITFLSSISFSKSSGNSSYKCSYQGKCSANQFLEVSGHGINAANAKANGYGKLIKEWQRTYKKPGGIRSSYGALTQIILLGGHGAQCRLVILARMKCTSNK